MICAGMLLSKQEGKLSQPGQDALNQAQQAFILSYRQEFSEAELKRVLSAVEEALTSRQSFYTLCRKYDLSISRPSVFSELKTGYCRILLGLLPI